MKPLSSNVFRWAVTRLILCFLSSVTLAETVSLSATDFPPYEFAKPEAGLRGFDVEVVEAAFERVNFSTAFHFLPWKRAIERTKLGQFTGLLSCAHNAEREALLVYSDPISESNQGYILLKSFSGFEPASISDAKSRRVGTVLGWSTEKAMKETGANVVSYRTDELVLKNLLKGFIDYTYLPLEGSLYRAKLLGISEEIRTISTRKVDYYVCFSKRWPGINEVVNKFNEGLRLVRLDGTYDRIHAKYK